MHEATVEKIENLSPAVKAFHLKVDGGSRFLFSPGQNVTLHLPVGGRTLSRSYSIASRPGNDPRFEVCIKHVRQGPGTDYLWSLKPGDRLQFSGPSGSFVLREPIEREALFVATGTGITPFRPMIHHALTRSGRHRLTLLFGARSEPDLLYRREWEALARAHPTFRFLPTLSRPEPGWRGSSGYVQDLTPSLLEKRRDVDVYICGQRTMVGKVREQCREWGYAGERVHFENYE